MQSKRRIFDVALATFALVLVAPVAVAVAIAIWLEDRGPVLFRQRRLGRGGKVFEVLKFRKFSTSAGAGSILTLTNDHRYSRVGRLLEKTKLNELPQLVNVLRGEMALVGPRPEIESFRHCFEGRYAQLLEHAPGIFGPSQTAFRNEAAMYPPNKEPEVFYEQVIFRGKAEIDLGYYPTASITGDIYWIGCSLLAVVGDACRTGPAAPPIAIAATGHRCLQDSRSEHSRTADRLKKLGASTSELASRRPDRTRAQLGSVSSDRVSK